MKKNYLFAFVAVAIMTGFTACSNHVEDALIPENEIRLTSEITSSRVTALDYHSTQIAQGQQVGVTIAGAQGEHKNVAWSVGQGGTLTNTGNPVYWGEGQVSITAYHPYHAIWTGTSHEFAVNTDQSTDSGYANSDLLWVTTPASVTDDAVRLNFAHLLAKINITLSSDDIKDLSGTTISICGTKIKTTFDPTTGVVSEASDIQEIKASVTTSEACTASAIIVPQTVAKGTKFIKLTRGNKIYYYSLPGEMQYLSGRSYGYSIKLEDSNMESPIEGEETEW